MIRYSILPLSDVTNVLLNNSINRKIDGLRLSLNGIYCVMKFNDEDELARKAFEKYKQYLYNEIVTVMENGEW